MFLPATLRREHVSDIVQAMCSHAADNRWSDSILCNWLPGLFSFTTKQFLQVHANSYSIVLSSFLSFSQKPFTSSSILSILTWSLRCRLYIEVSILCTDLVFSSLTFLNIWRCMAVEELRWEWEGKDEKHCEPKVDSCHSNFILVCNHVNNTNWLTDDVWRQNWCLKLIGEKNYTSTSLSNLTLFSHLLSEFIRVKPRLVFRTYLLMIPTFCHHQIKSCDSLNNISNFPKIECLRIERCALMLEKYGT